LQANDAQLGQAGVELSDVAHPITAVDQTAQAGPTGEGQETSQYQHQAEAQAQFHVDANVAKPAIHQIPPGTLRCLSSVGWKIVVVKSQQKRLTELYRRLALNLKIFLPGRKMTGKKKPAGERAKTLVS
jgi:hypothetical protein